MAAPANEHAQGGALAASGPPGALLPAFAAAFWYWSAQDPEGVGLRTRAQ